MVISIDFFTEQSTVHNVAQNVTQRISARPEIVLFLHHFPSDIRNVIDLE